MRQMHEKHIMSRRRAYVLVAVLALAALATSLGVSFLEVNSTAMPEAMNYRAQVRAQYLADSGLAMAAHYLTYPPTSVALGQYWTGQSNVSLDGGTDVFTVSVAQSKTDLNRYTIDSVGVAKDPDGSARAKRAVTADVIVPVTDKWTIPYALVDRDVLNVISRVNVTGGIRANGAIDLYLGSSYSSSVISTGTVRREIALNIFSSACLLAAITCNAQAYKCPTGAVAKYQNYIVSGRYNTAHSYDQYNRSTLNKPNADALNAINMSATNLGRMIVYTNGHLTMRANSGNVKLNGGLIVTTGDLIFSDPGSYEITAEEGYPALVLAGNFRVIGANVNVKIVGPVLCVGDLDLDNKSNVVVDLFGTLVKTGTFEDIRNDSSFNMTWTDTRSWFWDVEAPVKPYTILNWNEK